MTSESTFYLDVGRRISNRRRACGYRQVDLARMIDLSRPSVVNIEAGRHKISVYRLVQIADALDTTPSSLIPIGKEPKKLPPELERELKHLSETERRWLENILTT